MLRISTVLSCRSSRHGGISSSLSSSSSSIAYMHSGNTSVVRGRLNVTIYAPLLRVNQHHNVMSTTIPSNYGIGMSIASSRRHFAGVAARVAGRIGARLLAWPAVMGFGGYKGYEWVHDKIPTLPPPPDVDLSPLLEWGREASLSLFEVRESLSDASATVWDRIASLLPEAAKASASNTSSFTDDYGDSSSHIEGEDQREKIIASLERQLEELQERTQSELFEVQERMQSVVDRLQEENQRLRESYLSAKAAGIRARSLDSGDAPRSLIEMYSDVLDTLSSADSSYNAHDHLPRVVVVGDQSSGKTSVLEMLAQARIFPRGHGEMMTRSPVQVTLSEDTSRQAQFRDSDRVYDLALEEDLQQLRDEVARRMSASVAAGVEGAAVSADTVSLSVSGPGLPRMVLVDLPGIISHVTRGMAPSTKDDIVALSRSYIENPNAIILVVQDGSVDAERSNVADIVHGVDPQGQRTIFVYTKIDMAEKLNMSPRKIRQILEGRLFSLKALGYYAVVTGRGGQDDSIESIKRYEEDFFRKSVLVKSGALKATQATTRNLSRAISKEFWSQVRASVAAQADVVRADLHNKETEWRNTFRGRVMTRDEVFALGKHAILEHVAEFGKVSARQWEAQLASLTWSALESKAMEDIYLESAKGATRPSEFQTRMDVQLLEWARHDLPTLCVKIGKKALGDEFSRLLQQPPTIAGWADAGDVFAGLIAEVAYLGQDDTVGNSNNEIMNDKRASILGWTRDSINHLGIMQAHTLEDSEITNETAWQAAVAFMTSKVNDYNATLQTQARDRFGPGCREQYWRWISPTAKQRRSRAIRDQLMHFFTVKRVEDLKQDLDHEDVSTARHNVKKVSSLDVSSEDIRDTFEFLQRIDFAKRSAEAAAFCKRHYDLVSGAEDSADAFGGDEAPGSSSINSGTSFNGVNSDSGRRAVVDSGPNGLACRDVVLFWRLQELIRVTSKALRQQVSTQKGKLEREVKAVLESVSVDERRKARLVSGRRIDLAEEIEATRRLHALLDAFISELNKDTSSSTTASVGKDSNAR